MRAVANDVPAATGLAYSSYTANTSVAGIVTYMFNNVHATAANASIVFMFDATVLDLPINATNGKTLTSTVTIYTDGAKISTSTFDAQLLLSALSGQVWLDQNTHGVHDGSVVDINKAGIGVTLLDASNNVRQRRRPVADVGFRHRGGPGQLEHRVGRPDRGPGDGERDECWW